MSALDSRLSYLVAAIAFIAVAAACSAGGSAELRQHVHEDGAVHDHDSSGLVAATPEPFPTGLIENYVACMEALGYDLTSQDGIGMPDGTVFRYQGLGTPGPPPPVAYQNALAGCEAETGLDVARAERGQSSEYGEEEAAARNEYMIAVVQCLTDRGWNISPLVLDEARGTLVYEHTPEPANRAALTLDIDDCEFIVEGAAE